MGLNIIRLIVRLTPVVKNNKRELEKLWICLELRKYIQLTKVLSYGI